MSATLLTSNVGFEYIIWAELARLEYICIHVRYLLGGVWWYSFLSLAVIHV